MPEPVIVPPPPTISQSDNSPGLEQVQKAFDRAYPDRTRSQSQEPPTQPKSPEPEQEPIVQVPPEVPEPVTEPEPAAATEKLPNFLEEALRVETEGPPKPEDEWPEELPTFKSSDEAKARYKKWRESYNQVKREAQSRPTGPDEATIARMRQLEEQNTQMGQVLTRMGVEQHGEFQQKVIQPMTHAWQQAATIVQQAGGDPQELARAVQLQGKAHFEALDEVFEGLPESAKLEAHQQIAAYKRLDQIRQKALADAPKTYEALHKKDLERQYQSITEQRNEMKKLFVEAGRKLREVAKVEVLMKSDDPDAAWWNKQAEEIEQNANNLYMENTDMEKMAFATWLAPMADVYRKLWITERMAHQKTAKSLKEHFGAEPYIGEGGGGEHGGQSQMAEDLKKPFSQVFLREFHKAQARNR